jgi:glycosyltransferase involved in cell wall biosynthesis
MKRVLFVDHVNRILGGAEINLLELLSTPECREHWTVGCACAAGSRLSESVRALGIPQWDYSLTAGANETRFAGRRFSWGSAFRGLVGIRRAGRRLDTIVREFHPDHIVSCTNKDHFSAGAAAARALVPAYWWVNDLISPEFFAWPVRRAFCQRARKLAHRLIVVSGMGRQVLLEEGLEDQQMVIIRNGIPLGQYRRMERGFLRSRLGLPADALLVGIVGRFTPWKGQDFFLRIARAMRREFPSARFVLVGQAFNEDQSYEEALRAFVRQNDLSNRVHFSDFVDDVPAALSDLDVLVHAAIRPEPFGRVVMEGMAVGIPVLAAAAGGVPEIITDGHDGLLAQPGNLDQYVRQLRLLLADADFRGRLGAAAQETVRERFSIERVFREFDTTLNPGAPGVESTPAVVSTPDGSSEALSPRTSEAAPG